MGRTVKAGQMFVCVERGGRYFPHFDKYSLSQAIDIEDVVVFIRRASFDNRFAENESIVLTKYGIREIIGPSAHRWQPL